MSIRCLALLLLLCSIQSLAAVYKCKTDNGGITYSDKPCVGNGAVLPGYKYRDPGAPPAKFRGWGLDLLILVRAIRAALSRAKMCPLQKTRSKPKCAVTLS